MLAEGWRTCQRPDIWQAATVVTEPCHSDTLHWPRLWDRWISNRSTAQLRHVDWHYHQLTERHLNAKMLFCCHVIALRGASVAHWIDQHSYSMPDPVGAWTGDHFRTSKPPSHRTRHPGRLSLSHPSAGRQQWALAVAPATAKEEQRVLVTVGPVTRTARILA